MEWNLTSNFKYSCYRKIYDIIVLWISVINSIKRTRNASFVNKNEGWFTIRIDNKKQQNLYLDDPRDTLNFTFCCEVTIQFIIIIIIIILGISFMQGIYTYISAKNHVPRKQCVAGVLMVRISLVPALTPLYLYVSTFRSMCAVPNMAVFCSSLTSW
jgi:hypothetical protein